MRNHEKPLRPSPMVSLSLPAAPSLGAGSDAAVPTHRGRFWGCSDTAAIRVIPGHPAFFNQLCWGCERGQPVANSTRPLCHLTRCTSMAPQIPLEGKPVYEKKDKRLIENQKGTYNQEGWAITEGNKIVIPSRLLWPLVREEHGKTHWGVDALFNYLIERIVPWDKESPRGTSSLPRSCAMRRARSTAGFPLCALPHVCSSPSSVPGVTMGVTMGGDHGGDRGVSRQQSRGVSERSRAASSPQALSSLLSSPVFPPEP